MTEPAIGFEVAYAPTHTDYEVRLLIDGKRYSAIGLRSTTEDEARLEAADLIADIGAALGSVTSRYERKT